MHAARTEAAGRMGPRDTVADKAGDVDQDRQASLPVGNRRDGSDCAAMDDGILQSPRRFFRESSVRSSKNASAATAAAASAAAALVSAAGMGKLRLAKSGSRVPRRAPRSRRGVGSEPTSERGRWNAPFTQTTSDDGPASAPTVPCPRHGSESGTGGAKGPSHSGLGGGGSSSGGANACGGSGERRFLGSRAAAALQLLDQLSLIEALPSTVTGRTPGHGGVPSTTGAATTNAHPARKAD